MRRVWIRPTAHARATGRRRTGSTRPIPTTGDASRRLLDPAIRIRIPIRIRIWIGAGPGRSSSTSAGELKQNTIRRIDIITAAATAVEKSKNGKLGRVSATYSSIRSCSESCALRGNGCYAEAGRVGIITKQTGKAAEQLTKLEIAEVEGEAIARLSGRLPLRLHVVGDCDSDQAATVIANAAETYHRKAGSRVWGYTHSWRTVESAWWDVEGVAMRASCESTAQISDAHARGYAAVVVVDQHPESGRAWTSDQGDKIVPCPEQTRGMTCADCRLCWSNDKAITIAFAAHGPKRDAVRATVNVA